MDIFYFDIFYLYIIICALSSAVYRSTPALLMIVVLGLLHSSRSCASAQHN